MIANCSDNFLRGDDRSSCSVAYDAATSDGITPGKETRMIPRVLFSSSPRKTSVYFLRSRGSKESRESNATLRLLPGRLKSSLKKNEFLIERNETQKTIEVLV